MELVVLALLLLSAAIYLLRQQGSSSKGVGQSQGAGQGAPSPPGHWLLGHLPVMGKSNFHQQFVKWADEYGPVYRLQLGKPVYIVSDASLILPLITRGPLYAKKSKQVYHQSLVMSFGVVSIFNDVEDASPTWMRARKTMAMSFSTEAMKKAFPHILRGAEQLADAWRAKPRTAEGGGGLLVEDVYMDMLRCTLATICAAGFNVDVQVLGREPDEFLHVLHHALEELSLRMVNPFRAPFHQLTPFLASSRRVLGYFNRYCEIVEGLMHVLEARGPPADDDQSIGANVMRLKVDSEQGPALSPKQVLTNLGTFLVAGFDTSASALTWALYNIGLRPEVQAQCAAELQSLGLLQQPGSSHAATPLTWAHLGRLTYLTAVIKESMRLYTTAATGTFREAEQDMTLGGVHIPKGSAVFMPFVTAHTSTLNFLRPREFLPERWLQQEQEPQVEGTTAYTSEAAQSAALQQGVSKVGVPAHGLVSSRPTLSGNASAPPGKSWLAFSEGPRNCVGMSLANTSLKTLLATLLSRYSFSVHPDTGTPEQVEEQQTMALVLVPGGPIELVATPRF